MKAWAWGGMVLVVAGGVCPACSGRGSPAIQAPGADGFAAEERSSAGEGAGLDATRTEMSPEAHPGELLPDSRDEADARLDCRDATDGDGNLDVPADMTEDVVPECPATEGPCVLLGWSPEVGGCVAVPAEDGTPCEDGNACTSGDACVGGLCLAGEKVHCDDGNPCTDDGCSSLEGCVHLPAEHACDDGNQCTGGDQCVAGACEPGPLDLCPPCGSNADCLAYDDGDLCNGVLLCVAELCKAVPDTQVDCGPDQNPSDCTVPTCDPPTGQCVPLALPDGTTCDDGTLCTKSDSCKGGVCLGKPINCSDGFPCSTDSCDLATGECLHEPVLCDDGDACTTDQCNLWDGVCLHPAADCDDADACTADGCQPATGCTHETVACADGDPCTIDECTPAVGCSFPAVDCDDGDACTQDYCAPDILSPDVASCLHEPVVCADDNPCTADACSAAAGCQFSPAPAGTACGPTKNYSCLDGECVCLPDCAGKVCGADGCGGTCGSCLDSGLCCLGGACVESCCKNQSCTDGLCTWEAKECDDGNCQDLDGCCQGKICEFAVAPAVDDCHGEYSSVVAGLSGHSYLAIWEDYPFPGFWWPYNSLKARVFPCDGGFLGPVFDPSSMPSEAHRLSTLAPRPGGGALAAWSAWGFYGRFFDSSGQPFGENWFKSPAGEPEGSVAMGLPYAAALADGRFVVVWYIYHEVEDWVVWRAQLFSQDAAPDGEAFDLGNKAYGWDSGIAANIGSVAALPGGGFVAAWQTEGTPDDDVKCKSIVVRRFGADGKPQDDQALLGQCGSRNPTLAALTSGGFGLANLQAKAAAPGGMSVLLRLFGPGDAEDPISLDITGPECRADDYDRLGLQGLPDGGGVVVWNTEWCPAVASQAIVGLRFDKDSQPIGLPFRVDSDLYDPWFLSDPAVTAVCDGGFVVLFSGSIALCGVSDKYRVMALRFDKDGKRVYR